MSRRLALLLVPLALAACAKRGGSGATGPGDDAGARSTASSGSPAASRPALQLAYTRGFEVEAPAAAIRPLLSRHEAACEAAGPAVCLVVASSLEARSRDTVTARLEMRAQPAWLTGFNRTLDTDVTGAKGRIVRSETTSQDVTGGIAAAGAQAQTQSALRDRLHGAEAARPGKLGDAVSAETTAADAEAQRNHALADLADMRNRMAMSDETLAYRSDVGLAPLSSAAADGAEALVGSAALMLRAAIWLSPWLAAGGAVALGARSWRRRRGLSRLPAP
ncbi:MAG TPA: DUF4349 domain-containing protein [Caulobacteraceae bacterium]|jgi:hypothetical protein|nr:DUF4349 domain-containing protein [Caulobacteraceae bacterium]